MAMFFSVSLDWLWYFIICLQNLDCAIYHTLKSVWIEHTNDFSVLHLYLIRTNPVGRSKHRGLREVNRLLTNHKAQKTVCMCIPHIFHKKVRVRVALLLVFWLEQVLGFSVRPAFFYTEGNSFYSFQRKLCVGNLWKI